MVSPNMVVVLVDVVEVLVVDVTFDFANVTIGKRKRPSGDAHQHHVRIAEMKMSLVQYQVFHQEGTSSL